MPFSLPPIVDHGQTSLYRQGVRQEQLVVLSYETEADLEKGYVIYRGGVKATFGQTELTADVLVIRQGQHSDPQEVVTIGDQSFALRPLEAFAIGKVAIVDPDGNLQASDLWFTWDSERKSHPNEVTGIANTVDIRIETTHIKADKLQIATSKWDLTKVAMWTGNWRTPLFRFDADDVTIYPGKKGIANGMTLSMLGVKLPVIPRYSFSLDPRTGGFSIPTIGFRQGAGVGMSWNGNIPLNDASTLTASFAAFPKVQPTYAISYSKSNVSTEEIGPNQFRISDPFTERSQFSYFGNIYEESLQTAYAGMRTRKNLFSLNSTFNYETLGRKTDRVVNYSQPLEIGYENGGPEGGWAYLFQAKASRIVEAGNRSAARLGLNGSAFAPIATSGRFVAGTRFDAVVRVDGSSSGFLGAETGFSYKPRDSMAFAAGAYGYKNYGTPLFQGDQFVTNQGYVVRGDWYGAATNISLMFRYDPALGWFDREYRLAQVMGPIEPTLVFRESPRQYVIGIRLRIQDIGKLLQRRKFRDNNETTGAGNK